VGEFDAEPVFTGTGVSYPAREVHPKDWSPLPGVPMEKVTKPFDVYPECDYEAMGYPETAVGVSLDVESVKEVACVALDSMSRWLRALADGRL
jgi:hypothetical protein